MIPLYLCYQEEPAAIRSIPTRFLFCESLWQEARVSGCRAEEEEEQEGEWEGERGRKQGIDMTGWRGRTSSLVVHVLSFSSSSSPAYICFLFASYTVTNNQHHKPNHHVLKTSIIQQINHFWTLKQQPFPWPPYLFHPFHLRLILH